MSKLIITVFSFLLVCSVTFGQIVPKKIGAGYDFAYNGKATGKIFKQLYIQNSPQIGSLDLSNDLLSGSKLNLQFLSRLSPKRKKFGNLSVSNKALKKTGEIIYKYAKYKQRKLLENLVFHQIKGEDNRGNVHFTGYFTPVIEARRQSDELFKFPIYSLPKTKKKAFSQGYWP